MKAIINGKIIAPNDVYVGKALIFDDKILGIVDEKEISTAPYKGIELVNAGGNYVSAGLIDTHIHGYMGCDASYADVNGLRVMAEELAKNGVTSFLPTTMTVSVDDLQRAFDAARSIMKAENNPRGANVLGVNAEGPFINPKYKGAQSEKYIIPPDASFITRNSDVIRLTTIACEMPGALTAIREIVNAGVIVSIGHSAATYEQTMKGIEAGARRITHLFNAMSPLTHRSPGVVGAALTSDMVYTELIADCFHVNSSLFEMILRLKGDKLVLITDCTRAGGLKDGEYTLGNQPIFVSGAQCRLADGTIAGSVLKLNQAVNNYISNTSAPIERAVRLASANAAKSIGVFNTKGSLEIGKDADIILINDYFDVIRTYIAGRLIYDKEDGNA